MAETISRHRFSDPIKTRPYINLRTFDSRLFHGKDTKGLFVD